MIVRWGLASLPDVLAEMSVERPLLVTEERWRDLDLPVTRRFAGAKAHAEMEGVRGAADAARDADCLIALGGGSVLDTAKAVSAQTGLPVLSIPTTYAGAEWTPFFGNRDEATGLKSAGTGANVTAILYDAELTLSLPRAETGGTALNALAHAAEALYVPDRTEESDRDALAGAGLIAKWLPVVLENGRDHEARTHLLEGSMHAGSALRAGMGLGHAIAQALGGKLGLPHGAMSAISLPLALDFNRQTVPEAIARLAEAMESPDPITRCQELAALACRTRLRDYDVKREVLPQIAEAAATRPAAKANPRPASAEQILELLERAW